MGRNIYFKLYEASKAVSDKIAREIITKYLDKDKNELVKSLDDIKKEYSYYDEEDIEQGYKQDVEATEKGSDEAKDEETINNTNLSSLTSEQKETGEKIVEILKSFNIKVELVNARKGPNVTQYEFKLASGTKINDVLN